MENRKYLPDLENYFIDIQDEGFEMSCRESKKWGSTPDGEIDTIEILISRIGKEPRTNWYDYYRAPTSFTSENWGSIRGKVEEFCDRILNDLVFKNYHFDFRQWVIYGSTTMINSDNESIDTLPTVARIENFIRGGQDPKTISLEFSRYNDSIKWMAKYVDPSMAHYFESKKLK